MSILTVGSLFSGVGGLDLGLERAGMRVLWQVEKDPYAQKVLKKHWPDVRLYDDVQTVHGRSDWCDGKLAGCCLDDVDLICGGFPCQDISNAGKRAGIGGGRSGLWREFHRIVDEVRPSWVLIENVSALRSRGLAVVLSDLAASGYDAEWDCIPASAVGAPHRRDRIFVVAYANGGRAPQQPGRWSGASGAGSADTDRHGENGAVAYPQRVFGLARGTRDPEQGAARRDFGRSGERESVADTFGAGRSDAEGCGEDARVPGLGTVSSGGESDRASPRAVKPDVGRAFDGVPRGLDGHFWSGDWERGTPRVRHGVKHRVDRLRCLGNAVVPQVAEFVGRLIVGAVAQ